MPSSFDFLYGPIPLTVSAVIAILCILGYVYFVIPRMQSSEDLEKRNKELEGFLKKIVEDQGKENKNILTEFNSVKQQLASVTVSNNELLQEAKEAFTAFENSEDKNILGILVKMADEQNRLLDAVKSVSDELDSLTDKVDDMHQKQSTFLGVLMGAGLIRSSFNTKGVK